MPDPNLPRFPSGFKWGVATSSYQIEGAVQADGRGMSVWDTFTQQPGAIADGSSGAVACDHYHRMPEDVALMSELGVDAYRFSVAWPRIQPTGSGKTNPAGLAFYDRLVDELLAHGIAPLVTLFHWDLPQALQDAGGWMKRDTAARFADYADVLGNALGDRVAQWITLNEPVVVTELGYQLGLHAPGLRVLPELFPVVHHQLLGHGLATAALRANSPTPVALTNSYVPAWPVGPDGTRGSATTADREAAAVFEAIRHRMYTDPVLIGKYPDEAQLLTAGKLDEYVLDGDLAIISAPLDVLGVNYYNPAGIGALEPGDGTSGPAGDGSQPAQLRTHQHRPLAGYQQTAMGWPVVPAALTELLIGLRDTYGDRLPALWITENGCAVDDQPEPDGQVLDDFRIAYLDSHIRAVHAAIAAGVRVDGYCAWSMLDNFEWAEGYRKRFGLVYVDYQTQRRTPKASFRWYQDLLRASREPNR